MITVKELYRDIVGALEKRADAIIASKKTAKAKYFGVICKSYGIQKSEETELIRSYSDILRQLRLEERFELARMFYASDFSEQVNFGDAILQLSLEEITPTHCDFLDEIGGYLSNWADTDWFCIDILQPPLRKYPEVTLRLLRK